MARLGGLSSETFSPPAGLGSILRDQKVLPGVKSSRTSVVMSMVCHRPPVVQSVSVSSSPKDSFLLDVGAAEESDDLREEDVWGMEDSMEVGRDFEKPGRTAADDIHLGISPKETANFTKEELRFETGSFRNDYTDNIKPAKRKGKVADVFASHGERGSSPLSRVSQISPLSGRVRIPRRPSTSHMVSWSQGGQSAPVEVPKWSNMMAKRNTKVRLFDDDDKDARDDDDDRLPPHELLARENARSQRTTFSVCEGVGRTLKGRDMSRVRDAVWSQMGFED